MSKKTLDGILGELENAVQYDVQRRITQHSSGPSPKHTHAQTVAAIKELFHVLVSESYVPGSHTKLDAKTLNSKIEAL